MSASDETLSDSWSEKNGETVQIPESYNGLREHFSSLLKTAEIADVESVIDRFGHEDVSLEVNSSTDGNIRVVSFSILVWNWQEHIAGESAYSRQGLVDYRVDKDSETPDRLMYSNGAFFHKLENKFSGLFDKNPGQRPMMELDEFDNDKVVFSGTVCIHRYDD